MSAAETNRTSTGARSGNEVAIFLVVGVVFLGLIWLIGGGAERPLAKSATGFNGLVAWLRANDVEALPFEGGAPLVRGKIGLRILPLYDTDLENDRERPGSREEAIAETSESDLEQWVLVSKVQSLPTLVILPKWRAGMRKLGVAHKDLLIPEQEINRLLGQIGIDNGRIRRDGAGWLETIPSSEGEALDAPIGLLDAPIGLMHAQSLDTPAGCDALLGRGKTTWLARCPVPLHPNQKAGDMDAEDQTHFWIVSDPDLANTHGLRWAGNAAFALATIRRFEGEMPVILDLTNRALVVNDDWRARQHERTWEEFTRMFRWPFSMIWIAFAALGGLVLWRAVKRYGPLARVYPDEPGASKTISIDAKARLLRMANHDAALLGGHVQARLAHLVSELLGPNRKTDQEPLSILTRLIARRNPGLATELAQVSDIPTNGGLAAQEILRRLDLFETCYDKVTHEFGRTATPR